MYILIAVLAVLLVLAAGFAFLVIGVKKAMGDCAAAALGETRPERAPEEAQRLERENVA